MFSSNLTKFFAVFTPVFLFFTGCAWMSPGPAPTPLEKPSVAEVMQSGIPFKTTEPERFQAEIVVRTGEIERRTFVARDGLKRRTDFGLGEKTQLTSIEAEKNYLALPSQKIFTEVSQTNAAGDDWSGFLTTEWLSEKNSASFEKLETTGNITKYRVKIGADDASEIYVYVDDTIGLPVRQEYFSGTGESKSLRYSFELKNLLTETDAAQFVVPADFKKVAAAEFYKVLHSSEN